MKKNSFALLLAALFCGGAAAQNRSVSFGIDHFSTGFTEQAPRFFNGNGLLRLSADCARRCGPSSWLGFAVVGGISGNWVGRPAFGTRATGIEATGYFRKDWPLAKRFTAFGQSGLGVEHTKYEIFEFGGGRSGFRREVALLSTTLGLEFFFRKNWAMDFTFGGLSLQWSRVYSSGPQLPVSRGFSATAGLSGGVFGAAFRYFFTADFGSRKPG